jgi:hypothetical protein
VIGKLTLVLVLVLVLGSTAVNLNRQDAKVAKIIRQFTRMDEWARMDGVFLTAKNAKNAKGGREWVQMHANME